MDNGKSELAEGVNRLLPGFPHRHTSQLAQMLCLRTIKVNNIKTASRLIFDRSSHI
ncbi:MAG: hypothetical protein KME19_12410 [Microcoleus vaginatus WJT46-NPBG5]|nr:hypothetical protein [Microcoleus vaginatus WJT46-NPBG5]